MKFIKKTAATTASIGSIVAGVALAASLPADFHYRKIAFVGVENPIQIRTAYDYQQRTFIKTIDSDRPNSYSAERGAIIGAYTCHNNTIVQVPLFISGSYYVAEGMFRSLYLYRRATAPSVLDVDNGAPQLRGLLEGVVRLDYQGRAAMAIRGGRDDCMKMINDFFVALGNGGNAVVNLGTMGRKDPSDDIKAALQETARLAERGPTGFQSPPATPVQAGLEPLAQPRPRSGIAATPERVAAAPISKVFSTHVPFYVNRYVLGPRGMEAALAAAKSAANSDSIVITATPDRMESLQFLMSRDPSVELIDQEHLLALRASHLKNFLVSQGVPREKISIGNIPRDSLVSKYRHAVNAVVEFRRVVAGARQPTGTAVAAAPTQGDGALFVGERYRDEQIPVSVVIEPRSFALPSIGESRDANEPHGRGDGGQPMEVGVAPPPPAPPVAGPAPAPKGDFFTISGERGQMLSQILGGFMEENEYHLDWQVADNLDWRINADFHQRGKTLDEALREVLKSFPLRGYLDPQGRILIVRLRHPVNEHDAENPVPLTGYPALQ